MSYTASSGEGLQLPVNNSVRNNVRPNRLHLYWAVLGQAEEQGGVRDGDTRSGQVGGRIISKGAHHILYGLLVGTINSYVVGKL